MKIVDWVHIQPVLQTDRRIPSSSGIARWGCAWRAATAACEYHCNLQMDPDDIMMLHGEHRKLRMLGLQMHVPNFEKVMTHTLGFLNSGKAAYHVGNEEKFLLYAKPWRVDFCLLQVDTGKEDGHWRLGDADGIQLWDPDPAVAGELSGHILKFRFGGK